MQDNEIESFISQLAVHKEDDALARKESAVTERDLKLEIQTREIEVRGLIGLLQVVDEPGFKAWLDSKLASDMQLLRNILAAEELSPLQQGKLYGRLNHVLELRSDSRSLRDKLKKRQERLIQLNAKLNEVAK